MSMKRLMLVILISFLVSILTVFLFNYFNNHEKIGYIKSAVVLQEYKGMKDMSEQFNSELKIVQGNLDTLRNRYEKLLSVESTVSNADKEVFYYKLNVSKNEFEKYNLKATEDMQNRKVELTGKVLEKVNEFIQEYGKRNGYKLILGTTSDGNILYGLESDDLTEIILNSLNESYVKVD